MIRKMNNLVNHHVSLSIDITPWSWKYEPYYWRNSGTHDGCTWHELSLHWGPLRLDLMRG